MPRQRPFSLTTRRLNGEQPLVDVFVTLIGQIARNCPILPIPDHWWGGYWGVARQTKTGGNLSSRVPPVEWSERVFVSFSQRCHIDIVEVALVEAHVLDLAFQGFVLPAPIMSVAEHQERSRPPGSAPAMPR